MPFTPLQATVSSLMRQAARVSPEDSLDAAANIFREEGNAIIAVTNGPVLVGMVTENGLLRALGEGASPRGPVGSIAEPANTVHAYYTGAEALRQMDRAGVSTLLVIDDVGRLRGQISASDLYNTRPPQPRPTMIGGMATPFGVHLTTGGFRAGVPDYALIATGITLFSLFFVGQFAAYGLASAALDKGVSMQVASAMMQGLGYVFFLGGMRAIPLSGIHAAEHQVVHAIERGEELTLEVVRRMPRVHPRCGTNFAIGAVIFLSVFSSTIITKDPEIRLIMAFVLTMLFWRRLGSLVQFYITTRPPTDKQLEMGIRSGKELIEKLSSGRTGSDNPFVRLWNSGMFHVLTGSALALGITTGLAKLFNVELPF
ncbi:MAG: DUF1385 domain-containing protein [Fimbriimonas sp.]